MGWRHRWQMRRAAKNYARKLGPHLQGAYGANEHYSVGQIRTAVRKLGLNPKFIALGYAAFLLEEEYAASAGTAPLNLVYVEARALVDRFRPSKLAGSPSFYESRIGMQGGVDGHAGSP